MLENLIVLLIVGGATAWVARWVYRSLLPSGKSGCACPSASTCKAGASKSEPCAK